MFATHALMEEIESSVSRLTLRLFIRPRDITAGASWDSASVNHLTLGSSQLGFGLNVSFSPTNYLKIRPIDSPGLARFGSKNARSKWDHTEP
jgi:hypothetical protein